MLPGVSLKVLHKTDGPAAGYEVLMVHIEIAAGTLVPAHTHPGVESTFVLEGSGELRLDGEPPRSLKAGDAFQVPPDKVHCVQIGGQTARVCSTLIVRKGEPLVSPATIAATANEPV
jgi:quercetin dioxygenase-like cupin family protein